jgi:predicted transposase YbfD/YdcC
MTAKIENLITSAKDIKDPRRPYGNLRHKLIDILVIGLLSILCGGKDFVDMQVFGKAKRDWLSRFLELPNGIPDDETFRRIFEKVNPDELYKCLNDWLISAREYFVIKTIAIDGKTMKGSFSCFRDARHVVSAWASDVGLTLGQVCCDDKSNEITAIPQLLDVIDVAGAVVTIDAMGCQKKIAAKIISLDADYLLTLKANHKKLHNAVKELFCRIDNGEEDLRLDVYEYNSNGHGRIETRTIDVISAGNIPCKDDWENLQTIVRIRYKSICAKTGKETSQTRYFLTSLPPNARRLSGIIKSHWSIESHLHWVLDVVFEEDKSKAKKDNSPLNLNILRKIALSILMTKKEKGVSYNKMMFRAGLEQDYLEMVLFG